MASNKSPKVFIELVGWAGALLIIGAYVLYGYGYILATGKEFQFLNLFGSLGLIVASIYKKAWPATAVFVTWGLLSIYTLYVLFQTI